MMAESGELLEPFVPRSSFSSNNMYRQGSLIIILSVEDSQSGLLENFQPRNKTHFVQCDAADKECTHRQEDSEQGDSDGVNDAEKICVEEHGKRAALLSSIPNSQIPSSSPSVVDYIWEALPTMGWSTTSSPACDSSLELKDAELIKKSKWKTAMVAVQDIDDFRRLKKKMQSTNALTGGGVHQAMMKLMQQHQEEEHSTTPRSTTALRFKTLRRPSNSFRGSPSLVKTMAEVNRQSKYSALQVNLSPFASDKS